MSKTASLLEFSKYTSLSVLGMAAISGYILADTFFIARGLGADGLAALNLAMPTYNFIHGVGLMLGMGAATRFSVCKSRGEGRQADVMFTAALCLGAGFALLFLALGLFFSRPLTALLGADRTIFEMSNTYLKVLLLFSPAFLLNDILLCFIRNDGNPRLSMVATVTGSLANVVLDYIFIFPCGMGIFGAVFATGLAPVIGIAVMAPHWLSRSKGFHLTALERLGCPFRMTLSLGFPSLLGQVSSGIVTIVLNILILGLMGNTGVAAYGVIANLSLVVVAIYTGIAQGVQPLLSRAHGLRDRAALLRYLRYALVTMLALSALMYAGIFCFAGPIAALFNSDGSPQLQQIAVTGLKIYFTSVAFVGYNTVISTYFTSVERPLPAHVISLLRGLVLIIPAAVALSALWGMTGVWLSFPATELAVAGVGAGLYLRSRKSEPVRGSAEENGGDQQKEEVP